MKTVADKYESASKVVEAVVIRKDPFNGVHKQWQADLYFNDGNQWFSWQSNYPSKKKLVESIEALGYKLNIVRAPYKYSFDHDAQGDAVRRYQDL